MKKLAISILAIILAICINAQDPINDVFRKFENTKGFTNINLTGEFFNMLLKMSNEEVPQNMKTQIKEIKILAQGDLPNSDVNFHSMVYDKLNKKKYKEMVTVREVDNNVNILASEQKGIIDEILIIVSGTNNNALVRIRGDIVLEELSQLSDDVDIEGFNKLALLNKKNN